MMDPVWVAFYLAAEEQAVVRAVERRRRNRRIQIAAGITAGFLLVLAAFLVGRIY